MPPARDGGSDEPDRTTLAVVGLGLIGTSVALAARRRWPAIRIIGIDRPEKLRHQAVVHACDLAASDPGAAAGASHIVLAAPVEDIVKMLSSLTPVARSAVLVTDVGSTKQTIVAAARQAGLATFVGGHPMAGSELSGADAARADLFEGRPWFLIDDPDRSAHRHAAAFVSGLGATPVWTSAQAHDRLVAAVSHLPQIVASALMIVAGDAAGDEGLTWAGAGLRDTTRLAASPASVWQGILADNADAIGPLLLRLSDELRTIADGLTDTAVTGRLFDEANRQRRRL